jgi:serine/threonine-protein kinase HipA
MARRRQSGRLNVFLNSRPVGALDREASRAVDFRYAPDWLAWEHRLPVSPSLPLREDRFIGAPVLAVVDNFLPEDREPGPAGVIEAEPLADADVAARLANLARNPLGLERDDDFRISIAGVQEKTALLRYRGRWQKPRRSTPTTHIFKPRIGRVPNGIESGTRAGCRAGHHPRPRRARPGGGRARPAKPS